MSTLRHGLARRKTRSRVHRIWAAMLTRCRNPNQQSWARYGGRGIKVCARWLTFENFLEDMGHPGPTKSIDRINNDGNYEPGNCRWATRKQQRNNNSHIGFRVKDSDKKLVSLYLSGLSTREVASLVGMSSRGVIYRLRGHGVIRSQSAAAAIGCTKRDFSGKNNPNWRHGRRVSKA